MSGSANDKLLLELVVAVAVVDEVRDRGSNCDKTELLVPLDGGNRTLSAG
jgi:hypothetical protein